MRATINEGTPTWCPKKLTVTFDTEKEYKTFRNILITNESVPKVVSDFNHDSSFDRVKEILKILKTAFDRSEK